MYDSGIKVFVFLQICRFFFIFTVVEYYFVGKATFPKTKYFLRCIIEGTRVNRHPITFEQYLVVVGTQYPTTLILGLPIFRISVHKWYELEMRTVVATWRLWQSR